MICAIADIGGGGGGSDIVLCKYIKLQLYRHLLAAAVYFIVNNLI